ncbi:hypothetical protein HUT03_04335 [Candidatus Liberibacter africanus]|uniref:Phage-related integrase/recombinase n=1 Tax=Candidatus Liberibacter africanus PTSAPSY TaxID=1277257 RepID=A0A0G3I5F5_LIBAF|nr:hypothetical protein [Candidatus Liberibacter africanus]AKK20475.1 phage-related integrase/recombinase [Candidatus Liberibacter africanus PTSAPSY]QTP64190.1 hypothetical protein HUT03_04335 [Candidatus Liberibacter africanus]
MHIREEIEARKNTPAAAVKFLATMRSLFKWAHQHKYISINPCIGIEKPRHKTDGFKPWTIEEMQKSKLYWEEGTLPHLAFDFLLYMGLRVSDACRAEYQNLKVISFLSKPRK